MTRTEQAELAELGMNPERFERLKEVQAQIAKQSQEQDKVAREMNINPGIFAERTPGDGSVVVTEARSPTGKRIRSDARKARPKPQAPAPAPVGGLTESQWARVNVYFDRVIQSTMDLSNAERAHRNLVAEAHAYLDSLKGNA